MELLEVNPTQIRFNVPCMFGLELKPLSELVDFSIMEKEIKNTSNIYTISDWRKISPLMKDVLWASIQVELQTL